MSFVLCRFFFFKIKFLEKFLQEYHQSEYHQFVVLWNRLPSEVVLLEDLDHSGKESTRSTMGHIYKIQF